MISFFGAVQTRCLYPRQLMHAVRVAAQHLQPWMAARDLLRRAHERSRQRDPAAGRVPLFHWPKSGISPNYVTPSFFFEPLKPNVLELCHTPSGLPVSAQTRGRRAV